MDTEVPASLRVLTVTTEPSPGFDNWLRTAAEFGFSYSVIGWGEKWGGWPWRTRKYIEAINTLCSTDLVAIVDGTDLFFVGPPDDLVRSYTANFAAGSVVIGAESGCCSGGNDSNPIRKRRVHALSRERNASRYRYPNGGFVMGRASDLLCVLRDNLNERDDQEGYTNKWLTRYPRLELDHNQCLCGNLPNTEHMASIRPPDYDARMKEVDYWRVDPTTKRLQNVSTLCVPAVLHFPGGNRKDYNRLGALLFDPPLKYLQPKAQTYQQIFAGKEWYTLMSIPIYIAVVLFLYHKKH